MPAPPGHSAPAPASARSRGRCPPSSQGGRDKVGDMLSRRDVQRGRADADGGTHLPKSAAAQWARARLALRPATVSGASHGARCVAPAGGTRSPLRPSHAPAPREARGPWGPAAPVPPHLHLGVMRTRIQGSGARAHAGDKPARAMRSQRCAPPTRVPAEAHHRGGTPFLKSQGKAQLAASKSQGELQPAGWVFGNEPQGTPGPRDLVYQESAFHVSVTVTAW